MIKVLTEKISERSHLQKYRMQLIDLRHRGK